MPFMRGFYDTISMEGLVCHQENTSRLPNALNIFDAKSAESVIVS